MADPVRQPCAPREACLPLTFGIGRIHGPHSRQDHEACGGSVDVVHIELGVAGTNTYVCVAWTEACQTGRLLGRN
jgi:hypothetical protein